MSLHIECSLIDPTAGFLKAGTLVGSVTLPTSGQVSAPNLVPNDGKPYMLRLVPEVKMWVAIGPGDPNAGADPRRMLLANEALIVAAPPGTRVAWVTRV